jgi:glycosyltransferase involved in cell wall biosynthesis
MSAPQLSVVMPVHNALPFLDEAVASILGQSFKDFEFVILDDGSTDGSAEALARWAAKDARIRLVSSPANLGPVASSNRVAAEARAPLVARMDADDVADPDRLALQMALIRDDPGVVMVGSIYETIDGSGRRVRPADYARLSRESAFAPFAHCTILYRRDAFERAGGYREPAARWEDVDLYLRMAKEGRILVVAKPLVGVRVSGANSRLGAADGELEEAMDRMYRTVGASRPNKGGRGKLLPRSFLPGGSIRLWSGERPRMLGPLWRRGALRPDVATARMLVWAAWADLSPRSLRLFLKALVTVRNQSARRRIGGAPYVEWRPPRSA